MANSFLESIWQLISLFKISLYFSKSDTHIYRLIVPFQNSLKRCVSSNSFSKNFSLIIDYTIIFWRVMTFQSILWSVVISHWWQTFGHRLQDLKFKFQNPFWKAHLQSVSGNRLPPVPWVVENNCLRLKLINQCGILLTNKLRPYFFLDLVCLTLN